MSQLEEQTWLRRKKNTSRILSLKRAKTLRQDWWGEVRTLMIRCTLQRAWELWKKECNNIIISLRCWWKIIRSMWSCFQKILMKVKKFDLKQLIKLRLLTNTKCTTGQDELRMPANRKDYQSSKDCLLEVPKDHHSLKSKIIR